MTDRKLMQQALEALELLARYENPATKIQVRKPKDGSQIVTMYPHKVATDAAAPLRERLAQPEQEPVAWTTSLDFDDGDQEIIPAKDKGKLGTSNCDIPLYTAPQKAEQEPVQPPEWVGLTNKDIDDCYFAARQPDFDIWAFAAEIEEVLKKKNT